MTKFIERNWAKWEANLAPILDAAEKADANKDNRRKTMKMCEEDPDEAKSMPFQVSSQVQGQPQANVPVHQNNQQYLQQPVPQAPPAEPSFYEQFLKGKGGVDTE